MNRRSRSRPSGQTLLEFVITIPLFLLLMVAIIDFGRLALAYSSLANATREGARYGVVHLNDNAGVINTVRDRSIGLNLGSLSVVPTWNFNPSSPETSRVTVSSTYTFNWIIPLDNQAITFNSTMYLEDFDPSS